MTSLVEITVGRQTERVSNLSIVTMFSLAGIVLSLAAAHWSLDLGLIG